MDCTLNKQVDVLDIRLRIRAVIPAAPDPSACVTRLIQLLAQLPSLGEPRMARPHAPVRVERHIVAYYDALGEDHFRVHRDNTTMATAHRKYLQSSAGDRLQAADQP